MRQHILIVSLNCFEQVFERQRFKIYAVEDDDSRENIVTQIALVEVPRPLHNGQLYPTPVKLYQRIHDLERRVAAGDIAGSEEDALNYVKTFDEVPHVSERQTDSLLHLQGLFRNDT